MNVSSLCLGLDLRQSRGHLQLVRSKSQGIVGRLVLNRDVPGRRTRTKSKRLDSERLQIAIMSRGQNHNDIALLIDWFWKVVNRLRFAADFKLELAKRALFDR